MKSKRIAIGLTMTLLLGVAATAYAAETTTTASTTNTIHQRLGMGRATGLRGYDYVTSVLKNKLGLTDKEITDWLNSGKSLYDLAKSKGMTEEQFEAALLEERSKAIDDAVAKGSLTKEQGDIIKQNLKTNMANCTENLGQGCGNLSGAGCGITRGENGVGIGKGMNASGRGGRGLR